MDAARPVQDQQLTRRQQYGFLRLLLYHRQQLLLLSSYL
jgi:hypothetical protein